VKNGWDGRRHALIGDLRSGNAERPTTFWELLFIGSGGFHFQWTRRHAFRSIGPSLKSFRFAGWCRLWEWRVLLLALVTLSSPALAPAADAAPSTSGRPNIIFILADDLGYGDLGCYGQSKIKTPSLDRMAREGTRFTSFHAGSTVCSPSRAALMLGQHTGHLKIRGNARGATLLPGEITVAKLLQDAGYRTVLIGKWGLAEEGSTGVPQKQGFDEFLGYLDNQHAHNYYPDYLWRFDSASGFDGRKLLAKNAGGAKGEYVPDLCTSTAMEFSSSQKPGAVNASRPFFLMLCYTIPHANNEEGKRTGNGMEVPTDAPYSHQPWPQVEKNKAAMITRMDADIGRILEKLKELNMDEHTVVFFSSDNGPHKEGGADPKFFQSSGPFRGHKRDLTEGGIRVPLIVRWPEKAKSGTVVSEPWAHWDMLPTLAEIAHRPPPTNIDGISFLPTLLGKPQTNRHDYFYWEFHERGFQQAVRMGDWKAIRSQVDAPLELYNLRTDVAEQTDVAKAHPEILAKLESYLKQARTESERWPIKKPEPKSNPGNRKH